MGAIALLVYNIFGYTAGSVVPGLFMQFLKFREMELENGSHVENEQAELKFGMRLVLDWCCFGCLFLALAAYFAQRRLKRYHRDEHVRRPSSTATSTRSTS